jgi:hypothetical protein
MKDSMASESDGDKIAQLEVLHRDRDCTLEVQESNIYS